jgi:MutS-like protein
VNRLHSLQNRIARLDRRSKRLEQISSKYWLARRVIFISGSLLVLITWQFGARIGLLVAALFVIFFSVVAIFHNRLREAITRNDMMLQIKTVQVARINLDWQHLPPANHLPSIPDHPFETDIDVTGERSLHRLLDTAISKEGSLRLRSWLLNERPDLSTITRRQALVGELRNLANFRDKLQLYAAITSRETSGVLNAKTISHLERWESHTLVKWLEHVPIAGSLRPTLIVLSLLAAGNLLFFVLATLNVIPPVWPIALLIYVAAMMMNQNRIARAWGEVQDLEKALRRFGAVFKYLESRGCSRFPNLAIVCSSFLDPHKRPSAELRKVERIAAALGVRTNALLWLLVHLVIPWDFFFTYKLDKLKREISELLPRWLDAWYELETLNSLANLAWLNPAYVFPEIVNESGQFAARGIGHPLIKPDHKVCNDVALDEERRIIILTGSNMAGKSTFLRTVGLNMCLAYAGAPVNADRLQLSLLRLFTCIKVSDSVQDGLSYFYAEVKRLKLLLAAVEKEETLPVMFLIDEIFRGTNNRERHIGSYAFIKALSNQRDAPGFIATHDLELTSLAKEIRGIANYHFREEIADGRMVFDYLLREGPSPTTNALRIMRIEGLPVTN